MSGLSPKLIERLSAFVDGELPAAERKEVLALLDNDVEARRLVEDFRRLSLTVADEAVPPVPAGLAGRIARSPARQPALHGARRRRSPGSGWGRWRVPLAAAATLTLAALIGVVGLRHPPAPSTEADRGTSGQQSVAKPTAPPAAGEIHPEAKNEETTPSAGGAGTLESSPPPNLPARAIDEQAQPAVPEVAGPAAESPKKRTSASASSAPAFAPAPTAPPVAGPSGSPGGRRQAPPDDEAAAREPSVQQSGAGATARRDDTSRAADRLMAEREEMLDTAAQASAAKTARPRIPVATWQTGEPRSAAILRLEKVVLRLGGSLEPLPAKSPGWRVSIDGARLDELQRSLEADGKLGWSPARPEPAAGSLVFEIRLSRRADQPDRPR